MDVLVNKPQFDMNILQVGKAIRVKSIKGCNGFCNIDNDCLIVKSSPLGLQIAYLRDKELRKLDLPLGMVTTAIMRITRI